MDALPPPLAFVVLLFAGWVNRQQQAVVDYLLEENRVLRAAYRPRRLRLTDDQRRRREFVHQYHEERPHQGLGNELIAPRTTAVGTGEMQCRERLGGLLKFYYREAA